MGMGREIEGKEEVLVWHFISKSEDLLLFGERIWGEERKRTLKDDSCKVLNFTFLFGCF